MKDTEGKGKGREGREVEISPDHSSLLKSIGYPRKNCLIGAAFREGRRDNSLIRNQYSISISHPFFHSN